MATQSLVVAVVVVLCATYAAWTLMPAAARRAVAALVLRLALPERFARPFRKALQPAGACGGCDSCGDAAGKAPARVQTVTFHRLRR
jgi:hypothetical protein